MPIVKICSGTMIISEVGFPRLISDRGVILSVGMVWVICSSKLKNVTNCIVVEVIKMVFAENDSYRNSAPIRVGFKASSLLVRKVSGVAYGDRSTSMVWTSVARLLRLEPGPHKVVAGPGGTSSRVGKFPIRL